MGKKIFSDWAARYHEAGLSVIPLSGKVPIPKNWTAWSTRRQTEEELERLIEAFPTANIGCVLSGEFVALDVDTDDARILEAVPYSPLKRRGNKGFIWLFRSSLSTKGQAEYPFEVLSTGRQFVLPPSIHPDTGHAYVWVGDEDILHYPLKELPVLTQAHVNSIAHLCKRHGVLTKRAQSLTTGDFHAELTDTGRNNRLTSIAYAMACDDVPPPEAIERLLSLDRTEHDAPWFADPKEPHRGKNPEANARRMYERAQAAARRRGELHALQPLERTCGALVVESPLPRPRGLMRLFQDYCQTISNGNQSALGLGGAISLMSAVASNRYRAEFGQFDVWPNTYLINLAHSGFGKETPQRALDDLLIGTGLLGSSSYKSGTSVIMGLPAQQERLDLIDEFSAPLRAMASIKDDYKSEIVEILSSLYSKASSRFNGFASKADGANFGACWNPCVSILGSTTPQGFRSSVNRDMAAKGLLPRFLVFYQKDLGSFKGIKDRDKAQALFAEIARLCRIILSTSKGPHPDWAPPEVGLIPDERPVDISTRYLPTLVPASEGAQRAWLAIAERYFNLGKGDPEGFESAFRNRFAEHTAKLALLDTISLGLCEIGVDNVEWAHAVVVAQWEQARELYEFASAENLHEKDLLRVLQFIKKKRRVSKRDITRRFQDIWSQKLTGILQQLEEGGRIERGHDEDPEKLGRRPILYQAL